MYFTSYHSHLFQTQQEYPDNTNNLCASSSFPSSFHQTLPDNSSALPRTKLGNRNRITPKANLPYGQSQTCKLTKTDNQKYNQYEVPSIVQDENINSFNVKQNVETYNTNLKCSNYKTNQEVGVIKKPISKKSQSSQQRQLLQESNSSYHTLNNPSQSQDTKPSRVVSGTHPKGLRKGLQKREPTPVYEQNRVFSSDPLIGTLQQFFPDLAGSCEINTDNASLEQIDNLVSSLPFFKNQQTYETMKSLTSRQERLVCSQIKENKPVDIMEEISKISSEYDLKGLSLAQLHDKLSSIQNKFEEQRTIENNRLLELKEEDSPSQESIQIETPEKQCCNNIISEFVLTVKSMDIEGFNKQTNSTSIYNQEQTPRNQTNNIAQQICQKNTSGKQPRTHKRSESLDNNSCPRNQGKILLSASEITFTSPFRTTNSTTILPKDVLQGQRLQSAMRSSSSFKKGHNQFLDYIDDVLIEGAFSAEEDIFQKISSSEAVCAFSLQVLPKHLNHQQPRQVCNSSARTHNSSGKNPRNSQCGDRMHTEDGFETTGKKKYFHHCNRVRNFIAEEDDYESVHPFLLSSQQYNSSSGSRDHLRGQNTNNFSAISSFLRDIDDLGTFSQQGFL